MKILYIFVTALLLGIHSYAQEKNPIVKTSGESKVDWDKNKQKKEDIEKEAEHLAIVNALENAFGTVIVQGNTTFIKNVKTGQLTETFSTFSMLGNTIVKGELIEVLAKKFKESPYTIKVDKKKKIEKMDLVCQVTINAREITETKLPLETWSLSCPMIKCKNSSFVTGDEFYVYFKTPVTGYLSIYMDNNTTAQRIFPYQGVSTEYENGMPVDADKDYILFSSKPEYNPYADKNIQVDELAFGPPEDGVKELDRIFVIYSKNPLNKPALKDNVDYEVMKKLKDHGFTMPKELPSEEFQKWLIESRYIRTDIQVEIFDVSIDKLEK